MEAGEKKQVPKPTSPEDPKKAAGSNGSWRERAKSAEVSRETVPEQANNNRSIQKGPDPSKKARIVVESDSEDEEEIPVPYKKLEKVNSESPSREKPRTQPIPRVGERAYKLVSKFDDKKIVNNLVNKTERSVIEGVTVGELVAMSPEYGKELRKIVSRTRKPVVSQAMMGAIGQDALPFNDEDSEDPDVRYSLRSVEVGELPEVDSFYIATHEDAGTELGGMIAADPVLQYMHYLPPDEVPQPLYTATESASLRVVFPTINGGERVECVVDSGSQIVSMALKLAERLGIIWDPDVDKHAGRTAIKTFANDIKLHVYYSIRVSMSSVWLIREIFGWGHWTWRWGNSQRCEKVDYQDWSPYQHRGAPSIKESIQQRGEL